MNEAPKCWSLTKSMRRIFKLGSGLAPQMSNAEFLIILGELLYPAGISPGEFETLRIKLGDRTYKRRRFASRLLENKINDFQHQLEFHQEPPDSFWLMGNRNWQKISKMDWEAKAATLNLDLSAQQASIQSPRLNFSHSGCYTVSAIASLYKGGKYIEKFLTNITSQTIFDRSELIIIDANSPDREGELIAEFQKYYPNIIYKRMDYQVGIYEAWNIGIGLARGDYITNTNLDDLRSSDSFNLQASVLQKHSFVDVVYQDFLYTIDSKLGYDDVALMDCKSELPIATPNNMLMFNSPHNAPMWRKQLHKELGFFDTDFKSAGDYEFWLRCLTHHKTFFKINDPHIVYFKNPEGISTKPDTVGVIECQRIQKRYRPQLLSKYLKMPYADFINVLGGRPGFFKSKRYYDEVQKQLVRLPR